MKHIDISELEESFGEWTHYWKLEIDGVRINGGLATSTADAQFRADQAYQSYKWQFTCRIPYRSEYDRNYA
jgi:hypothetical protein